MAKWLITWEWAGEHARVDKKVAAIMDSRIGSERVRQTVELLYVNARCSLSERLYYAAYRKHNPYLAEYGTLRGARWLGQITCGQNPHLRARLVDNLKVERDADGEEQITWTKRPRPNVKP